MDKLKKSLDFINKQFEGVKLQNTALVATNKKLVESNDVLVRKVAALEQYSRANNLEIRCGPVAQGEECLEIVKQLSDTTGCTVQTQDIDTAPWVPTPNASQQNSSLTLASLVQQLIALTNGMFLWTELVLAKSGKPLTSRVHRVTCDQDLRVFGHK
ncbi:hypothetical protein HPB48_019681 [Haemaphysalis longicornis]|uniref:Uncharacterized protein n=1 Tax=Haemaphysalis longicornis TaxID=44386 RepID=A0A9J6G4T0_HAELO|nr:hypothetical protein HPB48_019681 [Haemaphysalis longicornis]